MTLWIKDPLACLAHGAQRGIVVDSDRIVELVPAGREPENKCDEVFDAGSHVVLPGLVNTHHHMFQTLTRAHPDAINKPLEPWLDALFPLWTRLTPEGVQLATRLALAELLMSGCTTATDHHYLVNEACEDGLNIQVEEARRMGVRMMVTRGSMDMGESDGGLVPDSVVQDRDTILDDCDRAFKAFHEPGQGAMIQIGLAPCTPYAVTRELMIETAELAEKLNCRLHTHLAETPNETSYSLERFNCRPVEYLEDVGWISGRTWVAHCIHVSDAEIQRLGQKTVSVSHCPTSNMVLASGHCRTRDLEAANVSVGLGVDGSASNDNSNLMECARHALFINRLTYDATVSHFDVLRWVTQGSARCIGREDIGELSVGKQADLAMFKLDELRFSGAGDPLAALILCGAHKADRVMVGGKWKVVDGQPIGVDLEHLRQEHSRAARIFLET